MMYGSRSWRWLKRKPLFTLSAAVAVAVLSAFVLYETMFASRQLGELGLLGMFLASLLSHLTVVGRDLFVPLYLPLTTIYNPFLLGSFAGWGGAIGEVATYFLGLGVGEAVDDRSRKSGVSRWIDKYGLAAILLVAASPLPDTSIILLAGSARFPVWKLLIVEGIGKTAWYSLGAFLGGFLFTAASDIMGDLLTSALVVAASVLFSIIVVWPKTRDKVLEAVKRLLPR